MAVEFAVECGDLFADFVASGLVLGIGLGCFGERLAGVVEVVGVEELARPFVESG